MRWVVLYKIHSYTELSVHADRLGAEKMTDDLRGRGCAILACMPELEFFRMFQVNQADPVPRPSLDPVPRRPMDHATYEKEATAALEDFKQKLAALEKHLHKYQEIGVSFTPEEVDYLICQIEKTADFIRAYTPFGAVAPKSYQLSSSIVQKLRAACQSK